MLHGRFHSGKDYAMETGMAYFTHYLWDYDCFDFPALVLFSGGMEGYRDTTENCVVNIEHRSMFWEKQKVKTKRNKTGPDA